MNQFDLNAAVPQLYETELQDRITGEAVRFITVPARSLEKQRLLEDPMAAFAELDFRVLGEPLHASELAYALVAVLQHPKAADEAFTALNHQRNYNPGGSHDEPALLEFAEYAVYGSVVPFERSPLAGVSLGEVLASGSGAGIGAGVGLMVAGGPTPLLFLTVPAGMIICASAKGISEAMSEGLQYHLRRLMRLPPEHK